MDKKNLFDNFTKTADDSCAINAKDYQNASLNDYRLWNVYFHACDPEGEKKLNDFASHNINLHWRNGVGYTNSCYVNNDTEVRLNAKQTSEKARNQLFHRFYQSNPYLGKGKTIPNVESRLLHSEDTSQLRLCNRLTEKDFDRFTPLVKCIGDTVQNPATVIYPWTNGGDNSRLIMRDCQAHKKCAWKSKNK